MQPLRHEKIHKNTKNMNKKAIDELSNKIIGAAIEVHKTLGPGFIEKLYERALVYEFQKRKIEFTNQRVIHVRYKEIRLGNQRIDFLIEDEIILELKAVSQIDKLHIAQMLSYLKATNKKLGLILNFAKPTLEIKRVIN